MACLSLLQLPPYTFSLYFVSMTQTGTIPASIVNVLGTSQGHLDVRLNYLSCCGLGFNADATLSNVR